MTAYCGGGTSSARPDFAATIYVAPAAAAALLNNIPTPWAVGLAAGLGLLTYELSTFCTTDPPAIPTFDAADYLALASPFPVPGRTAAITKLEALIGAYMWPILCQCDSTPTPAAGPPPDPPPGYQAPAGPIGQPVTDACQTWTDTKTSDFPAGTVTYRIFPSPLLASSAEPFDDWIRREPIPFGAKQLKGTCNFGAGAGTSLKIISTITFYATEVPGESAISAIAWDTFPGTTASAYIAVPENAIGWRLHAGKSISGGGAVSNDATWTVDAFCGAPEGGYTTPCCPPDPLVAETLSQILQLLTITQRQVAPFAYVYGANHTGLTGSGTIDVFGLIGCSVDVTTLPDSYGRADGAPILLYNLGRVNLGTADGYEHSRQIDHDGTLLLPSGAGAFTKIGYSLAPGVVVSIRELVREP